MKIAGVEPLLVAVLVNLLSLSIGDLLVNKAETVFVSSCIQGEVTVETFSNDWIAESKVVINGGEFYGFLDVNGKFNVCDVPAGTYLVEVLSPYFAFDPVRVDVSSKSGKMRAREVNIVKIKNISKRPYPLVFSSVGATQFFKKRESWSIISTLKNPMVLLLVAPLLLMMVLPKLMKSIDPEQQKEMQDSVSSLQQGTSMPSLEEFFTNMFGGAQGSTSVVKKNKNIKKIKQ